MVDVELLVNNDFVLGAASVVGSRDVDHVDHHNPCGAYAIIFQQRAFIDWPAADLVAGDRELKRWSTRTDQDTTNHRDNGDLETFLGHIVSFDTARLRVPRFAGGWFSDSTVFVKFLRVCLSIRRSVVWFSAGDRFP